MQIRNVEELKAWLAAGGVPDYLYFWGHTPAQSQVADKSCFSQWFPSPFSLSGVTYATAEHYMMAQKAALFGDTAVQARIVAAERPSEVKKLGREVANFDARVWAEARTGIVYDGNFAKFSQKPALRKFLLGTGERIIVEASPVDRIWGVGLASDNPRIADPHSWDGLNLLGFELMKVRTALRG
ncbi:NADAR family protein [Janthinobacterium sp.]|uniref:NADAR family protein n=1 Tax=Janthinobacterium sp. TaxID=1871054 RepID=UPI00260B4A2D|nr:NADAR family protein [Janthinobacterium sp.]